MKHQTLSLLIIFFSLMLIQGCSDSDSDQHDTPPTSQYIDTDNNDTDDNNDTVETNNSIHFTVSVPAITPTDEFICIHFDDDTLPQQMNQVDTTQWEITLEVNTTHAYRYCRNCECGAADEYFVTTEKGWRSVTALSGSTQEDNVSQWRWWTPELLAIDINSSDYTKVKPLHLPRTDFMSGVMFNDYWNAEWNLSINSTMAHIKADTNATWIEYAPVNDITQYYPTPKIDFDGANGTSQAELEAIIDAAKAVGLKVFINPIPWGLNVTDAQPNDHNASWWQAFYDEYQPIMIKYAQIAEQKDVDMLAFKMWPSIDALTTIEQSSMDDLALTLLHQVDGNFSGKIAVQAICYDEDRPDLKVYSDASSDYLIMNVWSYYPWALAQDPNDENAPADKDANVTTLKNHFAIHLDSGSYGSIEAFSIAHNKPIIFSQLAPAAYDGAIVAPADNDELLNPFYINDDSQYIMDLQEQADVMEAVLSEITQRDFIQGSFTFNYFYWNSIDKDINVRGKPAEKVMQKWYHWINQP